MLRSLVPLTACLSLTVLGGSAVAQAKATDARAASKKLDLRLLYVGKTGTDRAAAFQKFFQKHVTAVKTTSLDGSAVKLAKDCDVVVLDWPQGGGFSEKVKPLGERAGWSKPTVLLGSSGLMLSSVWRLRGGFG